ncbi:FAD-dependent oxidoreductase [Wolbachia endosymbiont of Folsomia candida]|uniref:FAD-dependent oxidoreductase n=1 Tax=Wolbachia endosymbiont of Folsomia candida TaxID=169402 RepID=UPI000DBF370B|nr:FAD-dependent monooxygenase [Wolbachia endosymbiont of Folsomia candida]APR98246.2 hypothetical protein ASM33_02990 [Wolbachia endosymbiont of Folsomia candida]
MSSVNRVIIVGSGPVGAFMAALISQLGIPVTVYEKREKFTRSINVKIEPGFFQKAHEVLKTLGIDDNFFNEINKSLGESDNKIVIKDLEERLKAQAVSLEAQYIRKEVNSFEEVYEKHKDSDPIILDCTGAKSKLRTNAFDGDEDNMVTIPLQHAMYINFKAKNVKPTALHQVMKNVGDIKLADIVASQSEDEITNVTIPVFISDELARAFDKNYPKINQNPLKPFQTADQVPDEILHPISSIISTLVLKGWEVDLSSVVVKKIEIDCGYAKKRSNDNYICLGDAAVHLAFFRSLNLGLEHALKFFVALSNYHQGTEEQVLSDKEVIKQFKRDNPHLNPIEVHKAKGRNSYLVVTKAMRHGCFHYCLTNHKTEKLTGFFGIGRTHVSGELEKLNNRLDNWKTVLEEFELERDRDIKNEIKGNKRKNVRYNFLARLISGFTGPSAAVSESMKEKAYVKLLYSQNYESFLGYFKILKGCGILDQNVDKKKTIDFVAKLLNEYKQPHKETESKTLLGKIRSFFYKCIKKVREFITNIFSNNNLKKNELLNKLTNICEDNTCSVEDKINSINTLVEKIGSFIKSDVELNFVINLIKNTIKQSEPPTLKEKAILENGQVRELEPEYYTSSTIDSMTDVENAKAKADSPNR